MHKLIATMVFLVAGITVTAQKGLFINPYFGAGITGVYDFRVLQHQTLRKETATTFGISAGYAFTHFRFSAGIAVLNNGFGINGLITEHYIDAVTGETVKAGDTVNTTYTFTYIALPVTVGYTINPGGKVSVIPEISLSHAYNITYIYEMDYATGVKRRNNYTATSGEKFTNFAMVSVNIGFKISKKMYLTLGPSYTRLINELLDSQAKLTTLTANAGVLLKL